MVKVSYNFINDMLILLIPRKSIEIRLATFRAYTILCKAIVK